MQLFRLFIFSSVFLLVSCASGPPKTFVETREDTGTWKSIYLHSDYGYFAHKNQEVWQRVVDTLSEKYDLETLDRPSGYVRSAWKYNRNTEKDKYRHRVLLKMQGSPWQTAKLKVEAQWWNNQNQSWLTGYDNTILEELYKDLQGRIGTSVQ